MEVKNMNRLFYLFSILIYVLFVFYYIGEMIIFYTAWTHNGITYVTINMLYGKFEQYGDLISHMITLGFIVFYAYLLFAERNRT
jgi:hypothetical protein